jgi:hypothetical protein
MSVLFSEQSTRSIKPGPKSGLWLSSSASKTLHGNQSLSRHGIIIIIVNLNKSSSSPTGDWEVDEA